MYNFMKGSIFSIQALPLIYLAKKKLPIEDYAKFCGDYFSTTWKAAKEQDWSLKQIARAIGLNYVPMGATVTMKEKDDAVIIKIADIEYEKFAKQFDVQKEVFEKFFTGISEPFFEYLELNYKIEMGDEAVKVTLRK